MAERYEDFFRRATGLAPFGFQAEAATRADLAVLDAPTGAGKTETAVVPFLWRHATGQEETTRLFYCLPMRTLVEQTADRVRGLVAKAGVDVAVHETLGGALDDDWVAHPDRPAVVVGTSDLLVSRALLRGYAARPGMWPMLFALCHNDATWVCDEVQLLGAALPTTLQLEAFRRALGTFGACRTLWMSATVVGDELETVDHPTPPPASWLTVGEDDIDGELARRVHAPKTGARSDDPLSAEAALAAHERALDEHGSGALTLVVTNTVRSAQDLSKRLATLLRGRAEAPATLLLHSRYRPPDRRARTDRLYELAADPGPGGAVVVATQVVEAGVDLDAAALLTEPCPWTSLVQRLGRLNRRGATRAPGRLYLHGVGEDALKKADGKPYPSADLAACLAHLDEIGLDELSPATLRRRPGPVSDRLWSVLRRADLQQLFDTTPNLEGEITSVAQWVREVEPTNVWIGWRDGDPAEDEPRLARDELCPAPVGEARELARRAPLWFRLPTDGSWERLTGERIRPGMELRARAADGGYDAGRGWQANSKAAVSPVVRPVPPLDEAAAGDADQATVPPRTLAEHGLEAREEAERLCAGRVGGLLDGLATSVREAAWLHDVGKAHAVFQDAVRALNPDLDDGVLYAKSGRAGRLRYKGVRYFRHEAASALRVAAASADGTVGLADPGLVCYLVGAHHGKVRLALPVWVDLDGSERGRVCGLADGDELPAIDCGEGAALAPWRVGDLAAWAWIDGGRWAAMARGLLARHGPFRLAYLETLVRAADWAASRKADG